MILDVLTFMRIGKSVSRFGKDPISGALLSNARIKYPKIVKVLFCLAHMLYFILNILEGGVCYFALFVYFWNYYMKIHRAVSVLENCDFSFQAQNLSYSLFVIR